MTRRRVLFLCTHNSTRSQMAEAFLHTQAVGRFDVASAWTEPRTSIRGHPHDGRGRNRSARAPLKRT